MQPPLLLGACHWSRCPIESRLCQTLDLPLRTLLALASCFCFARDQCGRCHDCLFGAVHVLKTGSSKLFSKQPISNFSNSTTCARATKGHQGRPEPPGPTLVTEASVSYSILSSNRDNRLVLASSILLGPFSDPYARPAIFETARIEHSHKPRCAALRCAASHKTRGPCHRLQCRVGNILPTWVTPTTPTCLTTILPRIFCPTLPFRTPALPMF